MVLRENRRVVKSSGAREEDLDEFHGVLTDIGRCNATAAVRQFLIEAYGKGAMATAKSEPFEGSTAVFIKRRYRDAWNRCMVGRIAKESRHAIKIRARCRATYENNQRYFHERKLKEVKKKVRAQALWNLHLAGDWLKDSVSPGKSKHLMRVMLISNVDVKQRFANGTQGRLLYWHPGFVENGQALLSSHPELLVRFVKETAYASERELIGEVHFMDFPARSEALKGNGIVGMSMVQVPILPAYALTIHKVQALTIVHKVRGCLEGIFAQGAVYVLTSRVDDPDNFELVGLPPKDLLDNVAEKWLDLGLDVNECLKAACAVTSEWVYAPAPHGRHPAAAVNVYSRLSKRQKKEQRIPVKLRTLQESLNPQPRMREVLFRLMLWIDREDAALRAGRTPPPFETEDCEPIFPPDDEEWWLTDVQKTETVGSHAAIENGPGSSEGERLPDDAIVSDDECNDDASEHDESAEDTKNDCHALWQNAVADFNLEAAESKPKSATDRLTPLMLWRDRGAQPAQLSSEEPTAAHCGTASATPADVHLRATQNDDDIELVD